MISTVCYFLLFSVVFAFDMYIYNGGDYYSKNRISVPVVKNTHYYDFEYHLDEALMMDIVLKNKAPNVTATVYVTSKNSSQTVGNTETKNMTQCIQGDCAGLCYRKLNSQFVNISMQLYRETVPCATDIISKGSATLSNKSSKDDLCMESRNCVLVIDLQNECREDNTGHLSSSSSTLTNIRNNVYIYAILSVVVLCVTIMVIYLSIKKIRNRCSGPEDTLELNTHATKNEVLYADLSFAQENTQPPRHEEESPYAQIVGVLKPY